MWQIIRNKNQKNLSTSNRTNKELSSTPFDEQNTNTLTNLRKGGVIHSIVRDELLQIVQSEEKEISFSTISDFVEGRVLQLRGGLAFPVGISVNEVAAHDSTLGLDDKRCIHLNDIVKIDFGVEIDGDIIDSAFTFKFGEETNYQKIISSDNPLIQSSVDATLSAISLCGEEARIFEISTEINDIINSYEMENGDRIRPVKNLGGHSIGKYQIHSGELIPCYPWKSVSDKKMKVGQLYALETFATTGNNIVVDSEEIECSHYSVKTPIGKNFPILDKVVSERKGLPFSRKWYFQSKTELNNYSSYFVEYPPLISKGGLVSQFEHTFMIKSDGIVEIFSLI